MAQVSISNANKVFGSPVESGSAVEVLRDFTLEVSEGEFLVLFGPNACGKTTLLNAIAGLISLDSGSISIGTTQSRTARISYIFQDYRETILPWRRVLDNIAYPLAIAGVNKQERHAIAIRLLKDMRILLPTDQWPGQLSGGQQQLLVITRALISEPELMLFDEPFNALDVEARIQMQHKLQYIWGKTGATIIFVSHDLDEALLLADRVVMLSRRPAQPVEIINVPFPRPRKQSLLEDSGFFEVRRHALKVFREIMAR